MRKNLISTLVLCSLALAANSRGDALGVPMETPFTRSVDRRLPLPEYPRPQFERQKWLNLNGEWDYVLESCDFEPVQGLTAAESHTTRPIPKEWTGKIVVPFAIDAPLSGVGHVLRPREVLWYGRGFDIPAEWKDHRVVLHFQAVDWETGVYVNGERVGQHRGGYDPFSFDITDCLRESGNVLNVCVWDATEGQAQALGKQIMPENRQGFRYQPTGGIWQTVWLEAVPPQAIESVKITPLYDRGSVKLEIGRRAGNHGVEVEILDGGRAVAAARTRGDELEIPIPDFRAWSPDDPHLYDVRLTLRDGEKVLDRVESYFGMRKIEVRRDGSGTPQIYLNGREVFQYGPLDQGYWPDGVLTPPSEDAMIFDLQYLKDINANMVRVHIKTHPDRWYYHADRLGILVWQDMVCMPKYGQTVTEEASRQWAREFRGMVDWLYNHPSIVLWVVFNEGWSQHDTERHTRWIEGYDPSRVVTGASGWSDFPVGKVMDVHDYTFYPSVNPDWKLSRARSALIGEAGGVNLAIPGHTWYSPARPPAQNGHRNYEPKANFSFTSEAGRHTYATAAQFEEAYVKYLRTLRWLRAAGGCTAMVYTQISDVEHELNGWLTYDRKLSKIPVERMRAINSTLYEKMETRALVDWGSTWRDGDGAAVKLPAGGENRWVAAPTPVELPVSLSATFTVEDIEGTYCVGLWGLTDCEIYLNGKLFRQTRLSPQTTEPSYSFYEIYPDERALLKQGENLVTVVPAGRARGAEPLFDLAVLRGE